MEWLIGNVSAVGLPINAESQMFWAIFGIFWPSLIAVVAREACFMSCKTHLSLKRLTYDNLLKIEWLITNTTADGLPPEQQVSS